MASANGKLERKHRELAYILGIHARKEPAIWCDHLPYVILAINTAYSRILNKTPFLNTLEIQDFICSP
jgi:hypothetical protein